MSDTFTVDTSFSSIITPTDGGTGQYSPDGRTGGFCKGVDNNNYIVLHGLGNTVHALCPQSGNVVSVLTARYQTDLLNIGFPYYASSNLDTYIAAPNTPYFWVFSFVADEATAFVGGILYKIIDDTTVTAVGGARLHTSSLDYYGQYNSYYAQYTIGTTVYALAQLLHDKVAVAAFPLTESVIIDDTVGSWSNYFTPVTQLGDSFFNFINGLRIDQGPATIVPIGSDWGIMVNVTQAIYDYVSTHSGINTLWDTLTGPCVLWFKSSDVTVTNVTSQFGITDIKTHLDGSVSSNYEDDYVSPNAFTISDRTYLAFVRSYTLPDDLEPIGTLARLRIYEWNSATTTAISALDVTTALFDTVVDGGVPEAQRCISFSQFVQALYDPVDLVIRYVWYGGGAGSGDFVLDYVFGNWVDVQPATVQAFALTFSAFKNTEFVDWQAADNTGSDFNSSLDTYYMLSNDTMLWMSDATVFTYVENISRGTGLGLMMQPKWDWSESVLSNKFARNVQVYLPTVLDLVSTRQNNIRGKGRALQLHFTSEQGKDFNLLGYGVWHQKNARP